jgi:YesN/AraC family two-component response regulator
MVIKALLLELLAILYRYFKKNNSLNENLISFQKAYDRLRNVLEYINADPGKNFSLEELAKVAFMNKTYFSAYFKKVMKITVFEYITHLKIDYACILLRTDRSSIAFFCRFSSENQRIE